MSSTAGALDQEPAYRNTPTLQRQLVTTSCLALLVLLCVLAVVLLVRRLTGAFAQPLSGFGFVLTSLGVVAAAAALRQSPISTRYSVLSTQHGRWLTIAPSAIALLILIALTVPGTPAWSLALAWMVLIGSETAYWLRDRLPNWPRAWHAPRERGSSAPEPKLDEPELPSGLIQQITRTREEDHETIHALVRASIAADDRLAIVHLSFCPPLVAQPELTAHALDADDAEIRITQTETFGTRLEVRLPQVAASPRDVLVEVLGAVTIPKGL
jgi:hypothetical protein